MGKDRCRELNVCSRLCHAARLGGDILPDEVMIPLVIFLYDCRCRILVAFTMSVKQDCLWDKTIAARAQHGPTIYPLAGLYGEHTSYSSSVLKHHSVPFAVLAIYDGSLSSQGKSSKVALQNYF